MFSVINISKSIAGRILFQNVNFHLQRNEKIGLIGPNGAGKSTLFSILLGQNDPDTGNIQKEKHLQVGYLPQESAPVADLSVLQIALGAIHPDDPIHWELEPKAKRILSGLSFREQDFNRNAKTLSGGWVMRCHLAALLVQEPDLLLLDEPTNHLDLHSLLWFQTYLKTYQGAILMISHDREFLNHLCTHTLEIANQQIHRYTGNYDSYLVEREIREQSHLAAYENQQKEIQKLQSWIDQYKAKNTMASRAQDKLKMIQRMELIPPPQSKPKEVTFSFPQPPRSGQHVLKLSDIAFSYTSSPLYQNLDLLIEREERTVLVGPNGAGKSTLLKLLAGRLTPQSGTYTPGHNVKLGYFSQYRHEILDPSQTVLQSAQSLPNRPTEQNARNLLGSFLFHGEDVHKSISVLSGGEKSRLGLARILLDPPNFILLDEPTTHLDIGSIQALIQALSHYKGTLVFISHDVYFIKAIATKVLHIDNGKITPYLGNYQYYLEKTKALNERSGTTNSLVSNPPAELINKPITNFKTKDQKRLEAQERNEKSRRKKELELSISSLEAEISQLEKKQDHILEELQLPQTYQNQPRFILLQQQYEEGQQQLQQITLKWETQAAELISHT